MPTDADWEALRQAAWKYYEDVVQHKTLIACWIELYKAIKYARGDEVAPNEDTKIDVLQKTYTGLAHEQDAADQLHKNIEQEQERQSQAVLAKYWQRVAKKRAGVEGMWLSAKDFLHDIVDKFDQLAVVGEGEWQEGWE